jgi:glycyl-tRNA synthetase beta chain
MAGCASQALTACAVRLNLRGQDLKPLAVERPSCRLWWIGQPFAEDDRSRSITMPMSLESRPDEMRGLAQETAASREEIKGPKASAPPQALEGFLRKTGLKREQLEERGGVLFAVIDRPGRTAAQVIGEALGRIVGDFPWPKSMRWGAASASDTAPRWVRPLHGIVALLGDEIVPFEVASITSGATTVGHRFHHPGAITIGGAGDYIEKLRACHVIVDQNERERLIREGAEKVAADAGLTLLPDEGLVVENAGLTEWPVPLLGRFDADYLDVPREVIVLTMRTNQKYFACTDGDGALAPAFLCVANIDANDGGAAIIEGNRRVLAARLADARFFWEQDLKVPLAEQAKKLGGIVFHENLGTVADKVERIEKLALWLVDTDIVKATENSSGAKTDLYNQTKAAARYCKSDLVTGMVGEFPELQGVIGGYLADAEGFPNGVGDAIRDHYQPAGQGDEVPMVPVTVAVALADKLDSISAFFAIDEKPTGSKDPFALRRSALGVIAIILANNLRLPLLRLAQSLAIFSSSTDSFAVFEKIYGHGFGDGLSPTEAAEVDRRKREEASRNLVDEIFPFIVDRLKVQQRDAGTRHDLIDAVFALGGEDDLVRLLARVKALQEFVETDEGRDLLAAYKRASNILKKEKWVGEQRDSRLRGNDEYLPEEQALVAALDAAEPKATAAIEAENFTAAMAALALLRKPIDEFFDKVTVNDPDAHTRARRLNLLLRFRDAVHRVADFSKIEG